MHVFLFMNIYIGRYICHPLIHTKIGLCVFVFQIMGHSDSKQHHDSFLWIASYTDPKVRHDVYFIMSIYFEFIGAEPQDQPVPAELFGHVWTMFFSWQFEWMYSLHRHFASSTKQIYMYRHARL